MESHLMSVRSLYSGLIKLGRPILNLSGITPWVELLDYILKKKSKLTGMLCDSCLRLLHCAVLTLMDCILELGAEINPAHH